MMPWLRLVRLPNLLTVPGDVLLGFWLVGGFGSLNPALLTATVAGLGIYLLGLLVNDWVDRDEDRRLRSDRPLARGDIGLGPFFAALGLLWLGSLAALLATGLPVLVTGVCLMSLALSYSLFLRRWVWIGLVTLGLCRVGLILLGALATGASPLIPNLALAVGTTFGWIVLVSALARDEVAQEGLRPRFHPHGLAAFILAAGILWLTVGTFTGELGRVLFSVLGLFLIFQAARPSARYWALARDRPKIIGHWLGLLILFQTWMILPTASWVTGLAIAAVGTLVWGIRGWLAQTFSAS
ncbi:MAG: UbiA family prenyltransferase [Verrucomicrobiia bacterium]